MHRVPSPGVDPRVKFLDDANAAHSSSFEHTPTPVLCRPCIVVLRKASSNRISLADETYSSSAFVSLQILIAFAPNPTYTFSAASATRGVCRFLSKQSQTVRFELHPGPRYKDCTWRVYRLGIQRRPLFRSATSRCNNNNVLFCNTYS